MHLIAEAYMMKEYAVDGIKRPIKLINIEVITTLLIKISLVAQVDFTEFSISELIVIRR